MFLFLAGNDEVQSETRRARVAKMPGKREREREVREDNAVPGWREKTEKSKF